MTMTSLLGSPADSERSRVRDGAAGRGEAAEPDGAEECENAVHDGYDADAAGRLPCSMPECGVAARIRGARMWRNW